MIVLCAAWSSVRFFAAAGRFQGSFFRARVVDYSGSGLPQASLHRSGIPFGHDLFLTLPVSGKVFEERA